MMDDFQFDLLGITESWLSPETPSHVYDVPCYSLHRSDRTIDLGDGGGGVVLYVKQGIKFVRRCLQNVDNRIEYISGVVNLKGLKLLICMAYKPPDVPYSTLSSLIHALYIDESPDVDSVILLGDFNVNLLDKKRADVKYLERILQAMGLAEIIKEPTRVTESSSSLIDLIIVDKAHNFEVGMVDTSNIFTQNGKRITDHKLTYCDVPCNKPKSKAKFILYRNFRDFDGDKFIDVATNIHWDDIMTQLNVNAIANEITTNIIQVFDECAPMVRKRITRKKSPWIDSNIKYLTKKKNKCKNDYLSLKSQASRSAYCRARNALNVTIRSAKRKYFTENLDPKNPKTFWATLRAGGVMSSVEAKDHSIGLEDLNNYFSTMGCSKTVSTEKVRFFNRNKCAEIKSPFTFSPVSVSKVKELMNSITSTAFGVDGISIKMLRGLSPFCIGAVTHLINASLNTGDFPSGWKQSVVVPLPKTLNPSLVSDFRPISILPVISKILEKVVVEQLVSHLETEGLLPETQSGFRQGFSTCSALLNVVDEMITAKDKGLESVMTSLDFSQAFDSVNFDLLLAKLRFYQFDDISVKWFSSYLTGRTQRTKVNGQFSSALSRSVGVPQGSCLGPILFLIYTADLKYHLSHCSLHSYADDSQLLISFKPSEAAEAVRCINTDLESVNRWSDDHGFLLNSNKCSVMLVDRSSSGAQSTNSCVEHCIFVDGQPLTSSNTLKVLGVTLDSQLDFSNHVKAIYKTVTIRLKTLRRLSSILPELSKLEIVRSTIFPVIYYALPVFACCLTQENLTILSRLQNRALRFVYNLKKFDHISEYRLNSKVLSIMGSSDMQTVNLIHKVLQTGKPEYLRRKLVFRHEVNERSTRQDSLLHLPKIKLETGKKGFRYFGPKKYNALPSTLKDCSLVRFKENVKEVFI